jgi:hypothetical protein
MKFEAVYYKFPLINSNMKAAETRQDEVDKDGLAAEEEAEEKVKAIMAKLQNRGLKEQVSR